MKARGPVLTLLLGDGRPRWWEPPEADGPDDDPNLWLEEEVLGEEEGPWPGGPRAERRKAPPR